MEVSFPKRGLAWKIPLALWLVFSVGYVVRDQWRTVIASRLQAARDEGKAEVVGEILRLAKSCEPFPVYSGDGRANMIDIDCLRRPAGNQSTTGSGPGGRADGRTVGASPPPGTAVLGGMNVLPAPEPSSAGERNPSAGVPVEPAGR